MERTYRLRKNRQYQYVYRRGKSAATKELVLLYVRSRQVQVGFSVSKKVGNAVVRNKTKRRLRECVRPYLGQLKNGSYVIVARPAAAEASFQTLGRSLHYLIKKQNLLQEGTPQE